jgi:small subunit ribosomal protein S5
MYWTPKTRLGKLVEKQEISNMADALSTRLPLREPEIVDILLPDLEDEVLDVNMVQRMTDSGRRVRFAVTTVVGNTNGYVGLGKAKGKEVGPTIRKAIDNAKLNIIEVRRGCGSWECGCGKPHSLPFDVSGKKGSVRVTFKPAPRGIELAVGDVAKPVLRLAGIKDAWVFTKGHTKTTANYAAAAFEALKKTAEMRVMRSQEEEMCITTGMIPGKEVESILEVTEKGDEIQPAVSKESQVKEEKEKKKNEAEKVIVEEKKDVEEKKEVKEKKEEVGKKEKEEDKPKVQEDPK